MSMVAEYVSKGHPDRLCDCIVNEIVNHVLKFDKDALCGLECAVHTNKVFVDGRIAAGRNDVIISEDDIKQIVRDVYENASYSNFQPKPENLDIILNVCIEKLSKDERKLRNYSDDQNVVNGYALNNPKTSYLPVAHFVALRIGEELEHEFLYEEILGPDFKLLVQIKKDGEKYEWERLTISVMHLEHSFEKIYKVVKERVDGVLYYLFSYNIPSLSKIDNDKLYVNGAGDFIQGGPEGDNGLSGKKLCIDYYGPSIPIGGGAILGKDPHKVDVCGAFRARELALKLVKEHGFYSVFTTLAWSPGEKSPYYVNAYEIDEFGTQFQIDDSLLPPKDYFSIECIFKDLKLGSRKIQNVKDIE